MGVSKKFISSAIPFRGVETKIVFELANKSKEVQGRVTMTGILSDLHMEQASHDADVDDSAIGAEFPISASTLLKSLNDFASESEEATPHFDRNAPQNTKIESHHQGEDPKTEASQFKGNLPLVESDSSGGRCQDFDLLQGDDVDNSFSRKEEDHGVEEIDMQEGSELLSLSEPIPNSCLGSGHHQETIPAVTIATTSPSLVEMGSPTTELIPCNLPNASFPLETMSPVPTFDHDCLAEGEKSIQSITFSHITPTLTLINAEEEQQQLDEKLQSENAQQQLETKRHPDEKLQSENVDKGNPVSESNHGRPGTKAERDGEVKTQHLLGRLGSLFGDLLGTSRKSRDVQVEADSTQFKVGESIENLNQMSPSEASKSENTCEHLNSYPRPHRLCPNEAIVIIQCAVRIKQAGAEVSRIRALKQSRHDSAGKLLFWAAWTIQKICRGRLGRKKAKGRRTFKEVSTCNIYFPIDDI